MNSVELPNLMLMPEVIARHPGRHARSDYAKFVIEIFIQACIELKLPKLLTPSSSTMTEIEWSNHLQMYFGLTPKQQDTFDSVLPPDGFAHPSLVTLKLWRQAGYNVQINKGVISLPFKTKVLGLFTTNRICRFCPVNVDLIFNDADDKFLYYKGLDYIYFDSDASALFAIHTLTVGQAISLSSFLISRMEDPSDAYDTHLKSLLSAELVKSYRSYSKVIEKQKNK